MKLVIAEKPSVAGEIAKVIGADKRNNGYYEGNGYVVTWCVGHLIENAMPEDYSEELKKWSLEKLPLAPEPWKTKVVEATKGQYKIIKELIKDDRVTELVCATDAGREGELIFRLVYNQIKCMKPFKRLWISSMTEQAIKDGFNNLKDGKEFDSLYESAFARSKADWLVGINATRLYTCIYNQMLSVGRVQTPTVNIIVKRQQEINNFTSKPYFIIKANCESFIAAKSVESLSESLSLINKCNGKTGLITELLKEEKVESANSLFDLTTLQREANRKLGFSAQQTLDLAQSLYEKKLITYPRTDSKFLTEDMKSETKNLIAELIKSKYVLEETKSIYKLEDINIDKIINDKKVSDHHAIIPTKIAVNDDLSLNKSEKGILHLVTYRLLQAIYRPYKYTLTQLTLEIEGEEFKATGKQVIDSGFKFLEQQLVTVLNPKLDENKKEKYTMLPKELQKNQEFDNVELTSEAKKTKPLAPYTEDSLLSAMENAGRLVEEESLKSSMSNGLGTPATRAGIIEQIIKKGFINREGKKLIPSELAFTIMDLLPEDIKQPELTAMWEYKLEQINQNKLSSEEFIKDIEKYIKDLIVSANTNIKKEAIKKNEKEVIGKCPRCKKNIYEGKLNFYCESGKECGFSMWKNDKFFSNAKKEITKKVAKTLLEDGKIKMIGLYSQKTGNKYDAYVVLKDTGVYVNFSLEFIN